MRSLPALASRRLSLSRWVVLALMGLCLPLQGVLAVTMQMSMAAEAAGLRAAVAAVAGLHAHEGDASPADLQVGSAGHDPHGDPSGAHTAHTAHTPHGAHTDRHPGAHPSAHPSAHIGHAEHGDPAADAAQAHQAHQAVDTAPAIHTAEPIHSAHASHVSGDDSAQHHGCSFCAQCCIGVALLATPLTVAAALPAGAPPTTAPSALLERQPQTPDRPPKHFLA